MKVAPLVIALSCFSNASLACDGDLPKLQQDMPYARARQLLLDNGWQALAIRSQETSLGSALEVWSAGFPEVYNCSGTGENICNYEFSNSMGQKLEVATKGEAADLKLFTWSLSK